MIKETFVSMCKLVAICVIVVVVMAAGSDLYRHFFPKPPLVVEVWNYVVTEGGEKDLVSISIMYPDGTEEMVHVNPVKE